MLSRKKTLSGLVALASLGCGVHAVLAICYTTAPINCCDNFAHDTDRTCGGTPCPDLLIQNLVINKAWPTETGLDSRTSPQNVLNCCQIEYRTCVSGSCQTVETSPSHNGTERSASGNACDESGGGGGGTTVTIDPRQPLP